MVRNEIVYPEEQLEHSEAEEVVGPKINPYADTSNSLRLNIGRVEYRWLGGTGVMFSRERVKKDTLREISGVLFYAGYIEKKGWFRKSIISWCTKEDVNYEWVHKFKKTIFRCN